MKTSKEKALAKCQLEIGKTIELIKAISSKLGLGELFYLSHYIHFIRLLSPPDEASEKKVHEMMTFQVDEIFKYLFQSIFSNGSHEAIKLENGRVINLELLLQLQEACTHLNTLQNTESLLSIAEKVEVFGERNESCKIDLINEHSNVKIKKFNEYGARSERENDRQKGDIKLKDDFLKNFKDKFSGYEDLFQEHFGFTLDKFIEMLDYLMESGSDRLNKNLPKFRKLENGNIDIQDYNSVILYSTSFLISKSDFENHFPEESELFLKHFAFNKEKFDDYQIRFNRCAREPIFVIDDIIYVVPEIILDSLNVNIHFSFLKSGDTKEEYKKRASEKFVDDLANKASDYGYTVFGKEIELYEGKRQLGDLDLVLFNEDKNHYLIIEAKNHALPLDVYFHDFTAMERHLNYLQTSWENKVSNRINHLKTNHDSYDLNDNFTYIIVSKNVEILSHFTDIIVVSELEFTDWLSNFPNETSGEEVLKKLIDLNETALSKEQLEELNREVLSGWTFE